MWPLILLNIVYIFFVGRGRNFSAIFLLLEFIICLISRWVSSSPIFNFVTLLESVVYIGVLFLFAESIFSALKNCAKIMDLTYCSLMQIFCVIQLIIWNISLTPTKIDTFFYFTGTFVILINIFNIGRDIRNLNKADIVSLIRSPGLTAWLMCLAII